MPKLISQFATAYEAFRLRKNHLRSDSGETSGANRTDIATVDRNQANGRVDVFFSHRRTRSTVSIVRHDKLFTFEVRRAEAVALETRLAAAASERRNALAEFLEQWRQL